MSISCKKATELVSKKEEGKISMSERYQLVQHMAVCYLCRFFSSQNKQILQSTIKYKNTEPQSKLSSSNKSAMINAILDSEEI